MTQGSTAARSARYIINTFFKADKALWLVFASLLLVSILVIYSSTASMAYRVAGGDTSYYVMRQAISIILGLIAISVIQLIRYKYYMKFAIFFFIVCLIPLIFTFLKMGTNYNDASRWLEIAGTGYTMQPSDFLRIGLIMLLSRTIHKRSEEMSTMRIIPTISKYTSMKLGITNYEIFRYGTIPMLLSTIVCCVLVLYSNFSTSVLIFGTSFLMLYIGGIRWQELMKLILIVSVTAAISISIMAVYGVGRSATIISRLETFIGLGENEDGTSVKAYQSEQARIAVASGGITGKGPGNSTQRANLPHSYSDFAFAFIVEEYGIVGALITLMLYLWVFFRAHYISKKCPDEFSRILVLGLALMIVLQALFNIMVSVGIAPVTGQPLPLISLGGSSMLSSCLAIGMILGVSRQINTQKISK